MTHHLPLSDMTPESELRLIENRGRGPSTLLIRGFPCETYCFELSSSFAKALGEEKSSDG